MYTLGIVIFYRCTVAECFSLKIRSNIGDQGSVGDDQWVFGADDRIPKIPADGNISTTIIERKDRVS